MNENIFDEELADKFVAEKQRPPRGKNLERAIRKLFASFIVYPFFPLETQKQMGYNTRVYAHFPSRDATNRTNERI